MKQADLDAVRKASKREREHVIQGCHDPSCTIVHHCPCGRCRHDRETIAEHMPALLRYIKDALAQPRREHYDLGDID